MIPEGLPLEFNVRYDEENDCLINSCTGRLTNAAVQPLAEEIINLASKHPCKRLLNDLRNVKIDIGIFHLFNLPEKLDFFGLDRSWKRAILVNGEGNKDAQFFETVARNRAYPVRLFIDPDEAIEWLKPAG